MEAEADDQPNGGSAEPRPIRRRIMVEGRVQGVGFRVSCVRAAGRAGVGGHVRNLEDGTVEVVAEGDPEAVEWLVDWCRTGPRFAKVRQVHVTDEPAQGGPDSDGFAIT